jgi:OFA family oxalate/formate antiporter-like MFS transporter
MKTLNRIAPLAASIAIQLCLGIVYVWSVFQTGIAVSIFGGDNAPASLAFSLMLATLTVGSILGGRLGAKRSARTVVIIGGAILGAGFLLASFVTPETPWFLWLGYGVMGGIGSGVTYATTIACAQKWYPEKKGFVTGLIVSALGLGGVLFTPIVEKLISTFGGAQVGEPKTFLTLGFIFLVVCTAGALFLKNPPQQAESASPAAPDDSLAPGQVLRDARFYIIAASMMLACMGGLMMIGFAKPIAAAKGLAETATAGVLIVSMCNSLGRLVWGAVSDKLGRSGTIVLLLAGSGILSALVGAVGGYFIYALIGLIGFFYGGFLSCFPSLTADLFGPKHMATNYGMVMAGFGAGAVASSYIAGYYKNLAATDISLMSPAFYIASGCAALGLILMLLLKKVPAKKVRGS